MRVRTNGVEIEVESRGEGTPLVLCMGIGSQLVAWPDGFLDRLVARGFRCIVFDWRDVGLSTRLDGSPPDIAKLVTRRAMGMSVAVPYTLSDLAGDVSGLIRELGIGPVHLVGISMGSMVAQLVAIEHPEQVRSLSLLMTSAGGLRSLLGKPRALQAFLGPVPKTQEEGVERLVGLFKVIGSPKFPTPDPIARERAWRIVRRAQNPNGFVRHLAAMVGTPSRRERLHEIKVPTLVMHGTDDPLILVRNGQECAQGIKGSRFRTIEGWGHDLPEPLWDTICDEIAATTGTAAR